MRIALISHEYPPFVGGGIGTYTTAAALELARAGHAVHVFTNGPTAAIDPPQVANLTVHRLPMYAADYERPAGQRVLGEDPAGWSYLSREVGADAESAAALAVADAVAALHREQRIDLVEVPDCMAEAFFLIRRRAAGQDLPPVVVHLHGHTRETYTKAEDPLRLGTPCIRARMVREDASIEHADGILSPSQANLDRFAQLYPRTFPQRRAVVPYYFTPPGDAPLPAGIGSWPYAVLVGRVEPRKGTDHALAAFAKVAPRHPELRLVLCGGAETWRFDEPFERVVARWLPAALRDRLVLLGRQPRDAAFAVLRRATLMLHPARWDNWPNAVLEAMAAGAPCIVSAAGGQAEMVQHGRSGLIVPLGDVDALAAAMTDLLARPDRGKSLGVAAQARLAELTDTAAIDRRKLSFFAEVVAGAATRQAAPAGPSLPGHGCLVLDADGAAPLHAADSRAAVAEALAGAHPRWRAVQLGGATPDGAGWSACAVGSGLPWRDSAADGCLVWLRAGAVPAPSALAQLLRLLQANPAPPGAFLWLRRSGAARFFPHRPDLGWRDVLLGNGVLPDVFATRLSALAPLRHLLGLSTPAARTAALLAFLARSAGRRLLHTGDLAGDQRTAPLALDADAQQRALGFLALHGALPADLLAVGCDPVPPPSHGGAGRLHRLSRLRARLDRHPLLGPRRSR